MTLIGYTMMCEQAGGNRAAALAANVMTRLPRGAASTGQPGSGRGGRQGGPIRHAEAACGVVADGGLAASDSGEIVTAFGSASQASSIMATDFFTVESVRLKTLYVLFFIDLGRGGEDSGAARIGS